MIKNKLKGLKKLIKQNKFIVTVEELGKKGGLSLCLKIPSSSLVFSFKQTCRTILQVVIIELITAPSKIHLRKIWEARIKAGISDK